MTLTLTIIAELRRPNGLPSGAPYSNTYRKAKKIHELISSWLSWLAVLLVGAYARRQRQRRREACNMAAIIQIIGCQRLTTLVCHVLLWYWTSMLWSIDPDIQESSDKLRFYLFADDTNVLFTDKNLKSLELSVNLELNKVYDWLTASKLTLNVKKSNFVIFCPAYRKLTYQPKIVIFDNEQNKVALEHKENVKYLGILIYKNLPWKHHIDHIIIKVSRTVRLSAKLRNFLPTRTLLNIY